MSFENECVVQNDNLYSEENELHIGTECVVTSENIDALMCPDLNEFENSGIHVPSTKSISNELQQWALRHNVHHNAVSDLLRILRDKLHQKVPRFARTLLKTPTSISLETIDGGKLWYHSIKNCLIHSKLANCLTNITINVNFNIDGLPLHKSTSTEFWPILMNIANMVEIKPMVVAIYVGSGKPKSILQYLDKFVTEFNEVCENGIENLKGATLKIKLNAFICDKPARALLKCMYIINLCFRMRIFGIYISSFKGVKNHGGYSSCTKCTVLGEYDKKGHHMSFPRLDCPLRTHDDFIRKVDEDHHIYNASKMEFLRSPLERMIGVDMIKSFPVSDSMHLIELGNIFQNKLYIVEFSNMNGLQES